MELFKYKNYKEYKDYQIEGYEAKKNTHSWVDTYAIRGLITYINEYNPEVSFGLCHGTRRGIEQQHFIDMFKRFLDKDVKVIGTEIAPDAADEFPNTIEWDFHDIKKEWVKNVDFIYSNSFDHSYKPEECLDTWMSCLNEKGLCIIEWTTDDENDSRAMDPFAASYDEYREMIEKKYEIVDVLQNEPRQSESLTATNVVRHFFIIRNKDNYETN